VELAYGSGLRRAELATLDVEDVNLIEQTVRVLGKGNKERIVPLSKRSVAVLNVYLQGLPSGQKPLFVLHDGRRIKIWEVAEEIKKSSGLKPHYLRHACATHMLLNGCNIRHIQQLLGHSSVITTQMYTKLDKEDLRKEINAKHPGRLGSDDPNARKDI
jgi:site-specific recombinase XerD